MNTVCEQFDGVDLLRPAAANFHWPHPAFEGFPPCCGRGDAGSLTERAIPETVLGMRISPACWVHDWMQTYGPSTWQNFHHSNAVLLNNLLAINRVRGGWLPLRLARLPILLCGYIAVSSAIGAANYFAKNQGEPGA